MVQVYITPRTARRICSPHPPLCVHSAALCARTHVHSSRFPKSPLCAVVVLLIVPAKRSNRPRLITCHTAYTARIYARSKCEWAHQREGQEVLTSRFTVPAHNTHTPQHRLLHWSPKVPSRSYKLNKSFLSLPKTEDNELITTSDEVIGKTRVDILCPGNVGRQYGRYTACAQIRGGARPTNKNHSRCRVLLGVRSQEGIHRLNVYLLSHTRI